MIDQWSRREVVIDQSQTFVSFCPLCSPSSDASIHTKSILQLKPYVNQTITELFLSLYRSVSIANIQLAQNYKVAGNTERKHCKLADFQRKLRIGVYFDTGILFLYHSSSRAISLRYRHTHCRTQTVHSRQLIALLAWNETHVKPHTHTHRHLPLFRSLPSQFWNNISTAAPTEEEVTQILIEGFTLLGWKRKPVDIIIHLARMTES